MEGLSEDESVPLNFNESSPVVQPGSGAGPQVRENVDAGVAVIDLEKMRLDLEARRGGEH
jgi:hypothetical protein